MRRSLAALLLAAPLLAAGAPPRSGHDDASPAVQAMQDDDAANPAMLWVQQGATLWEQAAGPEERSCAACHGPVSSMRGVAARHPRFSAALDRPVTLSQQVQQCRTERQGAPPLPPEGEEMLALTALLGLQSRGMPMAVEAAGAGPAAALERGRTLFNARMGQLNLSCAQCHDRLAGARLGGSRIPQGHPNGYPLYRLEWQGMGSLARRVRNCLTGVRAEPFPPGSEEAAALEFFLGWRAGGLAVETPAVRP